MYYKGRSPRKERYKDYSLWLEPDLPLEILLDSRKTEEEVLWGCSLVAYIQGYTALVKAEK
ncbi:MAG: hypothetical protein MjAS7_0004 [Metallosphaera javensis (ex Sakai et al. 2022)]|nr:MAG: hypothetical protein MjAS7_0004 [Metallosphaera javensis (ex Sakai et al. 2022)]